MSLKRIIGVIFVLLGVIIPIVIDAYETANHLDISRDIGALPWFILGGIGVILVLWSMFEKPRE